MGNTMLTPDHLHVLVNHLPIIGLIATLIPLLYALIRREKNTLLVSFLMCLIFGGSIAIVMDSGEEAEEDIEHGNRLSTMLDDAGRRWLHEHEERAEKGAIIAYVTAGIGLLGLLSLWKWTRAAFPIGILALLLCFASVAAMAWVSQAGGCIRHPEFRPIETNRP